MTILEADHLNWEFSDGCTMTHESIDGSWVIGQFLCYIGSSILDTTLTMCLIEIVYRGAQLLALLHCPNFGGQTIIVLQRRE